MAHNEDRGREGRMAIGRADHPQPQWGGQGITSWGRHGTGIGVCECWGSEQERRKNERRAYSRGEEGSV